MADYLSKLRVQTFCQQAFTQLVIIFAFSTDLLVLTFALLIFFVE